jgi:hypothetical protein
MRRSPPLRARRRPLAQLALAGPGPQAESRRWIALTIDWPLTPHGPAHPPKSFHLGKSAVADECRGGAVCGSWRARQRSVLRPSAVVPRPGGGRREDERNHTLPSAAGIAGPGRHRRHLRRPALGQGEHLLAGRDQEGPLHRRDQDQPAHRPSSARGPAMAGHPRPAHRFRGRTRTPQVPLDQNLRDRRRTRHNRLPHARLAIRVHRRRKQTGTRETRESVYAVTSLDAHQAGPADLAAAIRGHWGVENSSHHIRDVPSPKTPPPSTPEPHHGPWRPSAPSPSAC